ncbi:YesL family protein [Paenisporosarcina sp.]|uniref:YesL family protein n=1 Tax=Paenisporosarcina sp. TaxID=1932001 RepID=UPI003C732F1B
MNWDNFERVANRMIQLAYINVLWIFFTLVGLGIFGLSPSTTAMFGVVRKLIRKEVGIKIFPTFWSLFRQDFIKANGFGLILAAIAYFLYFDFTFIQLNNGRFDFLLPVIGFVLISCIATALFLFPVYAHFNLKFLHYIKQAFLIAITSPLEVLAIALLAGVTYFLLSLFPGAIPLFSGSVFAYFATIISIRAFRRIEDKKKISRT